MSDNVIYMQRAAILQDGRALGSNLHFLQIGGSGGLQRLEAEARKCLFDSVLAEDQRTAEICAAIIAFLELVDGAPAGHDLPSDKL